MLCIIGMQAFHLMTHTHVAVQQHLEAHLSCCVVENSVRSNTALTSYVCTWPQVALTYRSAAESDKSVR